jgi:two-component system cell cycle sensor histidine kinase/response regulator CckA
VRGKGGDSPRAAAGEEAPRDAPLRVLVADDDENHRRLLSAALATEGYETVEAVDGVDALEKLRSGGFDAVISDVLMPRMDGYRLGYEIRRSAELQNTRIIVYSRTYTSLADERMALRAGADRFLRNPLGTEMILRALRDATHTRRQRKAAVPPLTELATCREYSEVLVGRLESANLRLESANRKLEASRKRLARANEEIREKEERVRLLLDSTAEGIYGLDLDGNFTFCNAAGLAMLGYASARELLGRNAHTSIRHTRADGESYPMDESGVFRAIRENRGSHAEDEILWRTDGTSFSTESWSYPVRKDGTLVGAVVTFLDITERKRAEEAIRNLAAIVESSEDAIIGKALDGTITTWNVGAERLYGWPSSEAVGQPVGFQIPPDRRDEMRVILAKIRRGESIKHLETVRLRKNGDRIEVSLTVSSIHGAAGEVVGASSIARDITERKHAEKELRKSEERFRRLFDSNTIGISVADLGGQILESNDAYLAMIGYTREELLSGVVRWDDMTPAEYREKDQIAVEQLQRTGVAQPYEKELIRKDGTRTPLLIGIAMLEASEGSTIAYTVDLSSRRQLEEQFRQAQKMEAVGKLAGGVAHDFNNLLTVILGYSDLLAEKLDPGSLQSEELDEIRTAGERAASLTRQLLAFSRQQVLERKVLDVNDLIADVEKMLRRLIGEDVELVTVLSPALRRVFADAGQLEQVIMNLAVNARDAMPHGGRLTIETENVELDEAYARLHATVRPGSYVMIAVSDTGVGMNGETLAHMFEPFFTTKERGKGTGLGLATVYGIVKQSGGYVWVYSEVGKGTTFKIYLPLVEEGAETEPVPAAEPAALHGSETVLLVEDEQSVRTLSRSILEGYGYTVLEAASGKEGLEVARHYARPIDLVLTDVVMPEMGGSDMASRLEALRPGVRVLYMSGYTDDAVFRHGLLEKGRVFLQKPFTPETLARKVREALGG